MLSTRRSRGEATADGTTGDKPKDGHASSIFIDTSMCGAASTAEESWSRPLMDGHLPVLEISMILSFASDRRSKKPPLVSLSRRIHVRVCKHVCACMYMYIMHGPCISVVQARGRCRVDASWRTPDASCAVVVWWLAAPVWHDRRTALR